ncbi:hypothetical protein Taro_040828 [Colocasia esculenta]|uniref:Uncharacterized protein n=1 Tax=Colocasia esculenta TaxID=4460 RepID=A0A843WU42_COLES|nr:hypothetical protein [Colocasia esculenta]
MNTTTCTVVISNRFYVSAATCVPRSAYRVIMVESRRQAEGEAVAGFGGNFGHLAVRLAWFRHEEELRSAGNLCKLGCNAFCGYLSSRLPRHRVLGFCSDMVGTIMVCVVFLDTLTAEFELYVWLRERRQGAETRVCGFLDHVEVERQLDLSSVATRLRGASFFSFLSFLPSLLSSEVGRLPPSFSGGLGVVESPASSWRSGGVTWSEEEVVVFVDGACFGVIRPVLIVLLWFCTGGCLSVVSCRGTRQKVTCNLSRYGGDRLTVAFPSALQFPGPMSHSAFGSQRGYRRGVAFRIEGGTLVVATWWQQTTLLGVSRRGDVRARACWACLGYKPAWLPLSVFSRGAWRRHPTAVSVTCSMVPSVVAPECGRACGETFRLTWLLDVSRGDTWLFLPDLVEVWDVGACVMRLWSHVVAPVFCELLYPGGCEPRCCFRIVFDSISSLGVMSGPTLVVGRGITLFRCFLFGFIAYLTGLNSNPSGSSDPWVAVRPSGSLAGSGRSGRYSGIRAQGSNEIGFERELQKSVAAVAGCVCYERGCCFTCVAVGFVFGLHFRVGVSRRLREPTCGVAFIGTGLLSTEPSASLLELSRCFVCRVALLVERCDTCLWLLSALCWLVVSSSEVLPEFFYVVMVPLPLGLLLCSLKSSAVIPLWFEVFVV